MIRGDETKRKGPKVACVGRFGRPAATSTTLSTHEHRDGGGGRGFVVLSSRCTSPVGAALDRDESASGVSGWRKREDTETNSRAVEV